MKHWHFSLCASILNLRSLFLFHIVIDRVKKKTQAGTYLLIIYFDVTDNIAVVNLKSPLWCNQRNPFYCFQSRQTFGPYWDLALTEHCCPLSPNLNRHDGLCTPLREGLETAGKSTTVQITSVSPALTSMH